MADVTGVDPKALTDAADGINAIIKELGQLGFATDAMVGRGFDGLKMHGLKIGTPGLKDAFDDFCDRWMWGVRALVHDGDQIAQLLGLNAGTFQAEEDYTSGVFKRTAVDLMGNPTITADKAKDMSWTDIANAEVAGAKPDYSVQSFETAATNAGTNWQQAYQRMGPSGTVTDASNLATGN